jgi:hypothetical protein
MFIWVEKELFNLKTNIQIGGSFRLPPFMV